MEVHPAMCTSSTTPGGPIRCPADAYARARDADAALHAARVDLDATEATYRRARAHIIIAGLAELGIPAMDDVDCPQTYHIGDHLDLAEQAPERGGWKPRGLWTAPGRPAGDGTVKTGWMDWDVDYAGGDGSPHGRQVFAVNPEPGAVIVRLDTAADIRAFGAAFPHFLGRGDGTVTVDDAARESWGAVRAAGIDGILVTTDGLTAASGVRSGEQSSRRMTDLASDNAAAFATTLSQWDVASCCWLTNRNIRVDGTATAGTYSPAADDDDDDDYGWTPRVEPGDDFGTYNDGGPTTARGVPLSGPSA
jgi:hypothetical protein